MDRYCYNLWFLRYRRCYFPGFFKLTDYSFLIAIGAALLGGAMSPGPSFLVVAQNALSKSRAHGLATSVGTGLGAGVFALLAALGVTTLLEQTPTVYLVFRIVGGLYLLWLAYKIWQGANQPLNETAAGEQEKGGLAAAMFKGFVVQTSNPKTVFIIASIFSAVMPVDPPARTALYVTIIAFIVDFAWYAVVAVSLSRQNSRTFYQKTKVYFDRFAALLLLALSVKLFISIFQP